MKKSIVLLFLSASCQLGLGQLIVENSQTVEWYVQNVLLGGGVTAQNVTFNGIPANQVEAQLGYFNSDNANVGLSNGIILSSGNVIDAVGPNDNGAAGADLGNIGDVDLDGLSAFGTFDAAVLEFDFVPQGDSLFFNFVFGSEEYPEYVNDIFNDVFGFFLAGPGITGPYSSPAAFPNGSKNIAVIPGTNTPVAINDINNGNGNAGPCENCAFYVENGDGFTSPFDTDLEYIQYDGLTVPMTAMSEVQCGETYHIKIVLADAGDGSLDSGVFLEAGSFSANQQILVDLEFDIVSSFAANTLFEGCFNGTLLFERSSGFTNTGSVELLITGTATNGVDYTSVPQFITFLPGDSVVELEISAIADAIMEGTETVSIEVVGNQQVCSAQVPSIYTFNIADSAPEIILTGQDIDIDCNESADLSSIATGGLGFYEYVWDNGTLGNLLSVSPSSTTSYTLTATDTCVALPADAVFTVNVATYPDLELDLPADITLQCGDNDTIITPLSVQGGSQPLDYEWFLNGSLVGNDSSLPVNLTTSSNVNLTLTDQCGSTINESMALTVIPYTSPFVDLEAEYYTDCLDLDALIIPTTVSGGQGVFTYTWSENGEVNANGGPELNVNTSADDPLVSVVLTVTDECLFSFSDGSVVTYLPPDPMTINLPPSFDLICNESAISISPISLSGGAGALSYQWLENNTVISSDYDLETSTLIPTIYTFQVTDECDYQYESSVEVGILPYTSMSIQTYGDTSVCPGDLLTLTAGISGGMEPINYQWNHTTAGTPQTQVSPTESTFYVVTATDACHNSVTGSIAAQVTEVHAGFNLIMQDYHGFTTDNTSWSELSDTLVYTWFVDGEEVGQDVELSMHFDDMNDHTVSLLMTNEAGCTDSAFHHTEAPPTLFVPNAFTPDGDGLNDQFRVSGNNIKSYQIRIYDTWGNVVFESLDINQAWLGEGRSDSRHYADSDVYSYRIVAEGPGGYFEYFGNITLIR